MIEAPVSTPPQAYMDIISPLIDKARGFLEAGEKLQPFAFVGNLTTKQIIPVMIQPGSGEDNRGGTYRVAYTVRFEKAVYVLHCFQKKSPSGIRTAKTDVDLIHERLRGAQTDYEARYGKEG